MDKITDVLKLNTVLWHNSLHDWLIAAAITLGIGLTITLFKRLAIRRISKFARRSKTKIDDAIVKALQNTRLWLVYLVALYLGSQDLTLPDHANHIISVVATLAAFLQLGIWLSTLLKFWVDNARTHAMDTDASAASSLSAMSFVGRVVLWAVILLVVLDNLGVNVTTLVASLGVGGIAIGFALQNILGDLFASLSIILDKPFVIGDFIIADTYLGTVENIGIKTTRLRSIDGELLVFSNGDLIKSRLRNYKQMQQRRILFSFGVVYDVPADKVEQIPAMVHEIIDAQEKARFDRAHFKAFGASSLDFEVVYWMLTPDYAVYMDTQQAINLAMMRAFEKQDIGFAFPTRTLHHEGPIQVELAGQPTPSVGDVGAS